MEARIQTRRKLVQEYCKRHKRNDSIFGKDLHYFIVFRSRKVIYCFTPKVATTQWKKELLVLEGEDKQTYGDANFVINNNLNYVSPQEAEQMLKNYFTFLFVRDPMERLLSAYKDKLLKENKVFHHAFGRDIIKRCRPNATKHALETGSDVTFLEFVNYLTETRRVDEHWKSFDKICHPCAVDYDFIGRYEDLAEDAPYLVKKAGIDDRVSFPPFRASNTTAELLRYYSQIPEMKILELARHYESDYEMFGYSFPGKLGALFDSTDLS